MKTIKMICLAAAVCAPALASAQRGAVSVQRVERVERVDTGRTTNPGRDIDLRGRDIDIARGGMVETGTRIRPPHHYPARRRWNAANPPDDDSNARRRYYNATH